MELRVLLLCVVGCSLSWAIPLLTDNDDEPTDNPVLIDDPVLTDDLGTTSEVNNATNPDPSEILIGGEEEEDIVDIIRRENEDFSDWLYGGDIVSWTSRSVMPCTQCFWKKSANGFVAVPFVFSSQYGNFEKSYVRKVMKEFEVMTCVKFVNRTTEDDYIDISSAGGCWSYIGKIGRGQIVSLDFPGCIKYPLIQHELIHVLGFFHEHTRNDRDQYIKVLWDNISPDDRSNFEIDAGNTLKLPYGYNSIMHFDSKDYSDVYGSPSMIAIKNPKMHLGQRIGMNNLDVMKINHVYDCNLCRRKFLGESGGFAYYSVFSNEGATTCLYLIQTTLKVLLQLVGVSIPLSPDCNDSYIKIYDGVSQSSSVLLDRTCGNMNIPPLVSSGEFMLIEIVNSNPSALFRFNAQYKTVRYGGTFVTNNSIVTNPLYPLKYPNNVDVVYSIIAPKGYKFTLPSLKGGINLVADYF
ncbi:hatching enzyme 1.2-like [Dendropsophus ebraccatus]|uniref:hatching enzyme 1.2-like n=1 Tax=Dendropsophus ebraccatus TaxID=150705 RepID=UPI0038319D88